MTSSVLCGIISLVFILLTEAKMNYLFLILIVIFIIVQDIAKKQYNLKVEKSNGFIFSAIVALFAMLFFLASSGFKLNFTPEIIPYSLSFAATYGTALISVFLAIKWGPLALTLLVTSYSLIIPAFYGMIALGDPLNTTKIIGLALLAASLLMISTVLERKQGDRSNEKKFSVKWMVALILGFIGNGMCSVVQKMQAVAFYDEASNTSLYKNEFMIIALAGAFIVLVICALINKEDIRVGTVPCIGLAALTGISNGIVNLLVMVLSAPGKIDASILFPSISGGGIVLGFLLAIFVYKERLSKLQYVGYAIGTASVVLLNL